MNMIYHEKLSKIFSSGSQKLFKKGEIIYSEGDEPRNVYFIEKGLVALLRSSYQGQEHILRVFPSGRTIGHRSMLASEPYHATSKCLEDTVVIILSRESFLENLSRNPEQSFAVMELLAKELRQSEIRRLVNTDADVKTRVASAVLTLKKLYPDHLWTRSEIANFIASRTPTVIKVLGELESDGYISQNGRNIEIVDEGELRASLSGLE